VLAFVTTPYGSPIEEASQNSFFNSWAHRLDYGGLTIILFCILLFCILFKILNIKRDCFLKLEEKPLVKKSCSKAKEVWFLFLP
jgi:hypothetical protein